MITNGVYERVIIAGFGGQGVILAGKLLAQTGMTAGHEVTFMPSYGAEVRGGTANCMVVLSDEPIASPLVNKPDALIALNKVSLNKFTPRINQAGLLVVNRSMVDELPRREDIEMLAVPADDIANELASPKSTNMVALGAYLQKRHLLKPEMMIECLSEVLAKRYHNTLEVNAEAIRRGAEFAQNATNV